MPCRKAALGDQQSYHRDQSDGDADHEARDRRPPTNLDQPLDESLEEKNKCNDKEDAGTDDAHNGGNGRSLALLKKKVTMAPFSGGNNGDRSDR